MLTPQRRRLLSNAKQVEGVSCRPHGFTLVEMLVVISIIGVLSALLFPAFLTVQGKARQTVCSSNLRQIGLSVTMYTQDYDGLYPHAVDPMDRFAPGVWSRFPTFASAIPQIGLVHQVLQPYVVSASIFSCPADTGFANGDFNGLPLNAFPTSYTKFNTSYYYRTEFAARLANESTVASPSQINMLFDGTGLWHGTLIPIDRRYNVLFADGHVKNLSSQQMSEAWDTPLQMS